ncbi:hypothetical protein CCH79_00015439 [Gambusia affinis]|uniref:Nectin cell adhesion molecule 3 n=1 Tax=Gambusia affinis TaxID=33528 RepID=A0A315VP58_GAMAF|nr:hypothetical protein CCH79_00015439 [Gambusia affinis]
MMCQARKQTKQNQDPQGSRVSVSQVSVVILVSISCGSLEVFEMNGGKYGNVSVTRLEIRTRNRSTAPAADILKLCNCSYFIRMSSHVDIPASWPTCLGTSGQRVKVQPELASYPGQTVNLRCAFPDPKGIQLTMVTWIYEPKDGERMNIAVFHPNFGPNYPESQMKGRVTFKPSPPELSSPSIEISEVRMTDEGRYICEYATYPDGNEQGVTQLVMLAKPLNSATTVTVNAGTQPVVVARCESKDGRPAAKIQWLTTAKGNWTEKSQTAADNTVTVTSEYRLAPTAMDNGKDLTCLVNHRTQLKDESLPLKLAIQYPPVVEIEGYDNNWYVGRTNVGLLCKADANPVPFSVDWKTMTGEKPDTVQIKENELKVLKVDNSVNTTFVCEVKNSIGTTREQITINVRVRKTGRSHEQVEEDGDLISDYKARECVPR